MIRGSKFNLILGAAISLVIIGLTSHTAAALNDDIIVTAVLSGTTLNNQAPHGVAEHRTQPDGSRHFKVEAEDVNLPPGTVLNVFVNGVSIGSMTLDAIRKAELQLQTNDGETVPTVAAGTIVAVRSQGGSLIVAGAFDQGSPMPGPGPSPSPNGSPTPNPSPEDHARATVQFDAASFTVTEGTRSVAVTVTRVGDISRDSKVDYRSVEGSANERNDFTTAAGRLFFAPGEGSKTINVLITEDGFAESDETFFLMLFDASRSTEVGSPGTTTITIKDNDNPGTAVNPIEDARSFVVQHYMDFLNREPEAAGLGAWENVLRNCQQGDDRCDRVEVSSGFFRSPEFQDRGYFLYRFYSASLGRIPHYAEFEKDMSRTSGFYTDVEQETNKALFAEDFVTRQEFKDRYDQFTTAADYVNTLLNVASVNISNRDALIAALEARRMNRAQVLRAISESSELKAKYLTEAFVVMQYFGYLRRDPDPLYREWIRVMEETGDYRTMINGFIGSLEYRHRFGQ
ncbi:MAG TPA: Calx-beta domain-containing protein [Pyrinomonadaceae bacterium]|nr:Calx-beta domain-containing protein [Pyrinomonadaceae bacterium]